MNTTCELSANTERYLTRYREILSEMIEGMEDARTSNSVSGTFINQMLPHHRAAIAMSENVLRYTTNLTLQRAAESIISTQTESVAALERARRLCSRTCNAPRSAECYLSRAGTVMDDMFSRMEAAPALNSIDCDFIREMIPHHEGAIRMSRLALSFSLCPALVPILRSIITTQSLSLRTLRDLSRSLNCPQ